MNDRQIVEHTSPIWRVAGVALAFSAIAALGYYFQTIGYVDEFATVGVITVFSSVSFWARKRPDKLRKRFGPFGRIADAVRESGDDIRDFVYERPLRVGVVIAVAYGIAVVVVAKSLVVAVLTNIYARPIAAAAGCGIGAVVAAPEFFSSFARRLQVPDDDLLDEGLEDEDETEIEAARRRHAAGEE